MRQQTGSRCTVFHLYIGNSVFQFLRHLFTDDRCRLFLCHSINELMSVHMSSLYSNECRTLFHFTGIQLKVLHIHVKISRERTGCALYIIFPADSSVQFKVKFLIFFNRCSCWNTLLSYFSCSPGHYLISLDSSRYSASFKPIPFTSGTRFDLLRFCISPVDYFAGYTPAHFLSPDESA